MTCRRSPGVINYNIINGCIPFQCVKDYCSCWLSPAYPRWRWAIVLLVIPSCYVEFKYRLWKRCIIIGIYELYKHWYICTCSLGAEWRFRCLHQVVFWLTGFQFQYLTVSKYTVKIFHDGSSTKCLIICVSYWVNAPHQSFHADLHCCCLCKHLQEMISQIKADRLHINRSGARGSCRSVLKLWMVLWWCGSSSDKWSCFCEVKAPGKSWLLWVSLCTLIWQIMSIILFIYPE